MAVCQLSGVVMPSLQDSLLIFSDLDGSLLDIHTYEWQPAMPWLDTLQDN